MINAQAIASHNTLLDEAAVRAALQRGLSGHFSGKKVLALIPDHTRSLPLPLLFRLVVEALQDAHSLDFMVALGTHPPLSEVELCHLVGISLEERRERYGHIGLLNHAWDDPAALVSIGMLEEDEFKAIAGKDWHPSLPKQVNLQINRAALDCDEILILGPVFPHEVVGFSGGAKYLFPGISGADLIHAMHWLGGLAGVVGTIGMVDTPVRALIHTAAQRLSTPVTLAALVVTGHDLAGLFIGDLYQAWHAAVELSAQRNILWCPHPYQRVLSCAPTMYDELWTAAKAMYKLEPAVAQGGEVVIYAPHLQIVSRVHGQYIYQIGYHILPYFLANWPRFQDIPLGVLAHSTHLRGSGVMEGGVEKPNVRVTLASRIAPEDCARLNLGYLDPAKIRPQEWIGREQEGILYVPQAGEVLYKKEA